MWEHQPKRPATTDGSDNIAYFGKDVRFNGVVHFEGTLQIDSQFDGEIHTKGVLVIGEHAVIKATIHAGTVGLRCLDIRAAASVRPAARNSLASAPRRATNSPSSTP